jgi:O-antigen/teichoic acid export membrane protein
MGYWALVAGTLVGQTAQAVLLWRVSSWRPRWSFQIKVAKEMAQFGAWVGVAGLLAWFYVWADSLIVGMYLGSHELGLYRMGNEMAIMIFAIVFRPIVPVLYSHLARMNREKDRMRAAVEIVIRAIIFMAIPIALIVFSLANPIGDALFGPKWNGIGFVLGVMSLMHGVSWVVGINGEVYRAMGRPSYETIVTGSILVIYLGVYLITIKLGFEVFVWSRFGLALGAMLLHLVVIKRLLAMPILPIVNYFLIISGTCGLLISLVHYVLISNIQGSWLQILTGGTADVIVVAGALFLIGRNNVLKDLTAMIRGRSA